MKLEILIIPHCYQMINLANDQRPFWSLNRSRQKSKFKIGCVIEKELVCVWKREGGLRDPRSAWMWFVVPFPRAAPNYQRFTKLSDPLLNCPNNNI